MDSVRRHLIHFPSWGAKHQFDLSLNAKNAKLSTQRDRKQVQKSTDLQQNLEYCHEKVSYLQPTYAAMLACFVLVNKHRLALLCLPSEFPESLCGKPCICYTDTTTLCWREHRSAGKLSLFLLKLDQHSLPFNLDSLKIFTTNWIIA